MKPHLAVERLAERSPWPTAPFGWVTEPSKGVNSLGEAPMLSLNSGGWLEPRGSRDDGAQTSSESTTARSWLVDPGDLVLNPMWLVGGGVAVSSVAGAVSPDYRVFKVNQDTLDLRYLHHLLRSQPYRDQYSLYTRADTTFDRRVSRTTFASLPVLTPPLDTQRRIADMLDAETARIDTLIEKNERVTELLKLRLRAEVLRVLTGSDAVSVVGKAPVTYAETARLGLVVDTQLGKMLTTKPDRGLRETPYVKASDVLHDGTVRLAGLDTMYASAQERRELSLRTDDVLIIEGGATAGKAARVGDQPTEGIIFQNHVHRLRSRGSHLQAFLYWCMKAYEWTGWYDAYCFVTTFKGLPTGKLRSLPLPVLPIDEQRRIVAEIEERADDHKRLTRMVEYQSDLLRARRQALITAAVTGEIDTRGN